ncbi:MAG TPA: aromatic ring-hydroxylating dioxygenase subunit alpha [Kamptonema sp.]|nr:aromatic ring-hydroxylating dioxygenase subunit alpha [Kamptonema sp.]
MEAPTNNHLNNVDFIKDKELLNYLNNWQPHPVEKAVCLPAFMYVSDEVYRLEREKLFSRSWLFVGFVNQLEKPKSYFTVSIANISLLIVRNSQGNLGAFRNICSHRLLPLALESGKANCFVCPYHGWTYDLEGKLKSATEFEKHEDFDMSKYGLSSFHIDTWGPFIFVNLDPNCSPLKTQLGKLPKLFDDYKFSELSHVHTHDYQANINWKLYVENTVENYHVPFLHKGTYETPQLDWVSPVESFFQGKYNYYVEYSSFSTEGIEPGTVIEGLPPKLMQGYFWLSFWPNFCLFCLPNLVLVFLIDPISVSKTRVRWTWLVPNTIEAKSSENVQSLVEEYDNIQLQDLSLLPKIQDGLAFLGSSAGPLSPSKEPMVHRFHEVLMAYLTDSIGTEKFQNRNFDEEDLF